MYGIVLSFDQRASFVDLLLHQYNKLWLNCPLIFRVPYNDELPYYASKYKNIQFIKTSKEFIPTISNLLSGVADKEFVYWAIDDTYAVSLTKPNLLNQCIEYLKTAPQYVDAIRLMTSELDTQFKEPSIKVGQDIFKLRTPFSFRWFWGHHFVRSKYIKSLFLKSGIKDIWQVNGFDTKIEKVLPSFCHNVYMPAADILTAGETTRSNYNGRPGLYVTKNCLYDMQCTGIEPPKQYGPCDFVVYNNHRYAGDKIIKCDLK
jgi:hypothetical protein